MQNPTNHYQVDFTNIRYKYSDKADVINMCHHGAGYGAGSDIEQGFINVANQLDSIIYDTLPCRTSGGVSR